MTFIELHPAYSWDCDNCGRENFERGIVPHLSEEELEELKEEFGAAEWQTGVPVMMPNEVTCPHCQAVYSTIHYPDEE